MKKYIGGLLQLTAAGLLMFTIYKQNKVIQHYKASANVEIKSEDGKDTILNVDQTGAQNIVDSLQDEIFNSQSINGRYEMSLEHLKETNPKAAKQFEDYMNNETE
jgi:hypothetical protein